MKAQLGTQKGEHLVDFTEEQAREYIEKLMWPNGPVCPHCGSQACYRMEGETCRAGLHRCRECEKQFTVTVGTIFEDSHLSLATWIRAFHLMCSSKKGISALQMQRNLGLGSYRTAWHLCHRIRLAMQCEPLAGLLRGEAVECDETYVGGRRLGRGRLAGMQNKVSVVSLVERGGEGRKVSQVMPKVTAANLKEMIRHNVDPDSTTLNTDESLLYSGMHKILPHETVNHAEKQYIRKFKSGKTITTNTVESSFSLLKRGIVGAFHHVSPKHLHRYTGEFDYRWNNRKEKDTERTTRALRQAKGKRLSYKPLSGQAAKE